MQGPWAGLRASRSCGLSRPGSRPGLWVLTAPRLCPSCLFGRDVFFLLCHFLQTKHDLCRFYTSTGSREWLHKLCSYSVWFGMFEYKNLICLNHVLQFWRHFYWGLDSTDKVVPRSICLLVKEMLIPYHKLACFTFAVWENPFWPLVWVTTSLYLVNMYTCVFKTGL